MHTIVIAGAKGGVGTTTIAAAVASELSKHGPVWLDGRTTQRTSDLRAVLGMPDALETYQALWVATWTPPREGTTRIVDNGVLDDPNDDDGPSDERWLVVHNDYVSLRHAVTQAPWATDVVATIDPSRALGLADVTAVLNRDIRWSVAWTPAVARCVDAGLLATRVPRDLAAIADELAELVTP